MDTPGTKTALVLRDFRDAGTETEFKKGDTPNLPDGVFANYQAGGLVREATPDDVKPADAAL